MNKQKKKRIAPPPGVSLPVNGRLLPAAAGRAYTERGIGVPDCCRSFERLYGVS